MDLPGHNTAEFSPCRTYRYSLWRWWDRALPYAMFVGLNPSTADEVNNDPTVSRCINYARSWGYGGLCMTNIFAYRATDPAKMKAHPAPIGGENDRYLVTLAAQAGVVVAAWGTHGAHLGRGESVRQMLINLHCLRLTKNGYPNHPLYLSRSLKPVHWSAAGTL
jgi:hypothetical protein